MLRNKREEDKVETMESKTKIGQRNTMKIVCWKPKTREFVIQYRQESSVSSVKE